MRVRVLLFLILCVSVLGACNLGSDDGDESPTDEPLDSGRPQVTITSPQDGGEIVVNEPVLVRVSASDSVGVTQVRLDVDGLDQIVSRTVSSTESGGQTQGNFVLDFTPRSTGDILVTVRAFRNNVGSEPAEINLTVRASQTQVTATSSGGSNDPVIDPNDPTCRALINTNLNFRRGPGTNYDVIRVLGGGELLQVVGRLGNNTWLELLSSVTRGWVSADFVTLYGSNCSSIGVSIPPPSPTPQNQPTNTPLPSSTPVNTAVPTNTPVPQLPNLSAPSIGVPDDIVIPSGESDVTVTIGVTIRNNGGPINSQFTNTIRIGNDPVMDLGVVANLGAGENINLPIEVTFDAAGTYDIRVEVDSDDEIAEDSETDNIAIIEVEVTAE